MTSREVILEGGSPWGFRMHGGVDVGQPLRISRVNPGSKAAQRGVREGDIISVINNQPTSNLANEEAHSLLRTSRNVLLLGLNQDTSVKRRTHRQARPVPEQDTDVKPASSQHTGEAGTIGESLSPLPQRSDKLESTKPKNNATSTTNASHESTKSHRTHGGGKNKRNRRTKARKKLLRAQQNICDPVNVEICEPLWESIDEIVPLPETANASLLLSAEALCWNDEVKSDLFSKDEIQEIVDYHASYADYHNPKRKAKFKRGADQFCSSLPRLEVIAEEETGLEDGPLQDQEWDSDDSCHIHAISTEPSIENMQVIETDVNDNDVTQHENCTHEESNDNSHLIEKEIIETLNEISHSLSEEELNADTRLINNDSSVSDIIIEQKICNPTDEFCLDNEPNSSSSQENLKINNDLFCNETCIQDTSCMSEVQGKSTTDEIRVLSDCNEQQTNVKDATDFNETRKIMEVLMKKLVSTRESKQQLHEVSDESSKTLATDLQIENIDHSMSGFPINRYDVKCLSSFPRDSNSLYGLFKSTNYTERDEENNFSPVSNKSQDIIASMITPMSLRLLCVEVVSQLPNGLKLMLDWGLATIDELDLRIKSQLNIESAAALLPPDVNAAAPQAPPQARHRSVAASADTRAFHGTQGWLSVQAAYGPYYVCLSPSQQRSLPKLPHVSAERAAALLDMHCKVSRRRAYYEPNNMGLHHEEQRLKTTVLSDWLTYAKSDHRREQSPLTRFEKIDGDENHGTSPTAPVTNSIREIARKFEAQRYHISKQRDIAVEIQGQKLETKENEDISKNKTYINDTTDIFREKLYSGYQQQMAELATCRQNKISHLTSPNNPANPEEVQLEVLAEFAKRARTRMEKLGLTEEDAEEQAPCPCKPMTVEGGATQQLIHEVTTQRSLDDNGTMPVLAPTFKATAPKPGVWSPETRRAASAKAGAYEQSLEDSGQSRSATAGDEPPPAPVWTPKSSPTLERKEFRPVRFETTSPPVRNTPPDYTTPVSPPFDLKPVDFSHPKDKASNTISSSLDRKLTLSLSSRLPRAQNPTVTLLQKAREGQLPRGALYLDHKMNSKETAASSSSNGATKSGPVGQGDIVYAVKSETVNEDKKVVELAPKKYDGIGPTTKEGIPIVLRSGIKEENYGKWYKRMYDSLHKAGRDDDHITIRYRPNRRGYPYSAAGGYASEPEPAASYDSDIGYSAKYATLDRRRIRNKDGDFTTSTMPRSKYMAPSVKYACEVYKNQPGRIEDYEPGHSSISENEAKMQHIERNASNSTAKPFMTYALKESGYESDSQLVFKRRENGIDSDISPTERKVAYKSIQSGGDVPLHGLRKPAPERPKDPLVRPAYYQEYNSGQESPHKFVEGGEVTIHYRSPVRGLARDSALSEEELARRQEEAMRLIYQEERRRKYLQELHDMESRRHTDNFTQSQKSPIPLNRYDDYFDDLPSGRCHERTPEPKMVARALYNFVGQTPRELTFKRGDIIIVRRQIDKNWYEGEHNASIGLFPFNYIEIIPYDGVRTLPKRATEGKARAKFNFVAQTHLELSLIKGENVVLTRRVDDNWYEGRIGARKGIFPVSYVEVLQEPGERIEAPISQKPVASPASHSLLLNCSASSPSNRSLSQFNTYTPSKNYNQHGCSSVLATSSTKQLAPVDQALHIDTHSEPVPYRALYNYKPQNDDELELHEGDIVFVMEKCDDGWYVGSSNHSGHFGTFPGNYVERV